MEARRLEAKGKWLGAMRVRNVGASGLQVSEIGLGCNNFGWYIDLPATREVVHAALDAGITFFDTADVYGKKGLSEEYLGKTLGPKRKDIVLASKFGLPMHEGASAGGSRRYIMQAVEDSLRRLRTDWLDLYQLHRPDTHTPIEETLRTLDDLIGGGKVRYVGLSDMPAWQVVDAQWTARSRNLEGWVAAQYEYSLLARDAEREVLPAISRHGIGLLPYFPLASGMLTGKYHRDSAPAGRLATNFGSKFLTDENWAIVERLEEFALERNIGLLEVAFGWLLSRASVASVIAGATSADQVRRNVSAAKWVPTDEERELLDRISSKPSSS